ncbi:MAG: hypothetical protein U0840_15350 [Gemmataceae bacterium]
MHPSIRYMVLLVGVFLVTACVGRGILSVFRVRWLVRPRLENIVVWPFIGFAWWMLFAGWLAYLGFTARAALIPLGISAIAWSLGAVVGAKPLFASWKSVAGRRVWGGCGLVGGIVALGLVGQIISYSECTWPSWHSDARTYALLADYLQENRFSLSSSKEIDHRLPSAFWVYFYQHHGLRMGSTWILASLQGLTRWDVTALFVPLNGIGLALNFLGIYLLARWTLRLPLWPSLGITLLASLPVSPLITSIQCGFQPQMFGTAYLAFIAALLGRLQSPRLWKVSNAIPLSMGILALLSAYNEMTPLAGILSLGALGLMALRAWTCGYWRQLVPFAGTTFLALVLLGNVEWYRFYKALGLQINAVVGWPIPWSPTQYLLFLYGLYPWNAQGWFSPSLLMMLLVVAIPLSAVELFYCFKQRRWIVPMLVAVFLALMCVFLHKEDPFTHTQGHRWNLFKLAKWAFPVVVALPLAGSYRLVRNWRVAPTWFIAPGVVLLTLCYVSYPQAKSCYHSSFLQFGCHAPDIARHYLARQVKQRGFENVYVAYCGMNPVDETISKMVFCELPHLSATQPSLHHTLDLEVKEPEKTLLVTSHQPPFETPLETLPFNYKRLDAAVPHVYLLHSAHGGLQPHPDGGKWIRLDTASPVGLFVYSPRAAQAVLTLEVGNTGAKPGSKAINLNIAGNQTRTVPLTEAGTVEVPLDLPAGRCQVSIRPEEGDVPGGARWILRHGAIRFASSGGKPAALTRR